MKSLPFLIFTFFAINAFGQTPSYVAFPDSNATWCAQRSYLNFGNPSDIRVYDYILEMKGDTTINGIDYHKIYESGILTITPLPAGSPVSSYYSNQYQGGIRESSNKEIYAISPISGNEGMLYDFNLSLGDTLPFASYLMVTSIDSIFDGTIYRTKFNISSIDTITWSSPGYYEHVSLIEGIGSTGGLLWSLGPYFEHWGTLSEFTIDNNVYYQDSMMSCNLSLNTVETFINEPINIYPLPCIDILFVDFNHYKILTKKIVIYDILGKIVLDKILQEKKSELDLSKLESGIYIYKLFDENSFITSGKILKQ